MALTQIVNDGLGASLTATSEGGAVTTSVQQGLCKVWLGTTGDGTPAVGDSHNVSSLTDEAVGDLTVSFSNALNNANYGGGAIPREDLAGVYIQSVGSKTTTSYRLKSHADGGAGSRDTDKDYSVHGDLA